MPYRAFERANIGQFFETASISRFFVVFSAVSAGFGAVWAALPRQIGLCLVSGRRGCRRGGGGVRLSVGGVVFPVGGTGFPVGGTGFPIGGVVADSGGGVPKIYFEKILFCPATAAAVLSRAWWALSFTSGKETFFFFLSSFYLILICAKRCANLCAKMFLVC